MTISVALAQEGVIGLFIAPLREVRVAVPTATLTLEWGNADAFFGAIDDYLTAVGRKNSV